MNNIKPLVLNEHTAEVAAPARRQPKTEDNFILNDTKMIISLALFWIDEANLEVNTG